MKMMPQTDVCDWMSDRLIDYIDNWHTTNCYISLCSSGCENVAARQVAYQTCGMAALSTSAGNGMTFDGMLSDLIAQVFTDYTGSMQASCQ